MSLGREECKMIVGMRKLKVEGLFFEMWDFDTLALNLIFETPISIFNLCSKVSFIL